MAQYILREDALQFSFDDSHWNYVEKLDTHHDYRKMSDNLERSKGADFFAANCAKKRLLFVEVKDYRGHRIENKSKTANEYYELCTTIGRKVRDSLACCVAAYQNTTHHTDFWADIMQILANKKREIIVVLWLEEDANQANPSDTYKKRGSVGKGNQLQQLKKRLKWLTTSVSISCMADNNIAGLSVKNVAAD